MNVSFSDARAINKVAPTIIVLAILALILTTLVYQIPVTAVIDVGSGRDTPFVQGFSFRESFDAGSFRWSGDAARISFWGIGAQDGVLKLKFALPEQNRAAGLQIWVNGRNLGAFAPINGFQEFTIEPITRGDIGPSGNLFVTLVATTFSAPPDPRHLGAQVDYAQFTGSGTPAIPAPRALVYLSALTVLAFVIGRVWSGTRVVGWVAAIVTLFCAILGLFNTRVETAYFVAPLFWFALLLFLGALALVRLLQRLTGALNAPPLAPRTLRLVLLVMLGAFSLRMIFAVGPGFIVDTQDYVVWSYKTVTYGLGAMYSAVEGLWISDQSPGLNYILHAMGLLYRGIFSPDFLYPAVAGDPALRGVSDNPAMLADPVQRTLLRLPMLFADVITGALILATARKYLSARGAWLAALAFWFNPAVVWNGAYWGQTDAIHSLLVLICFLLVGFTRRVGLAFFIFGVAAFTKPQAMIFGPLLLLAAFRLAHLAGVARALVFGALGAALLLLPVILTGGARGLFVYFGDTVGHHPTLSANAHNLWWLVFHDDVDIADTAAIFPGAPLSYRAFSILLFGVLYVFALLKAWRAPLQEYFMYGAFVAFAFFMLPTEIHENYGYALLPLLAVAMTRDKNLIAFYAAVSATMVLNYALHDPPLYEHWGLTDPHAQWALPRWLNSVANMAILAAWTIYLWVRQPCGSVNRTAWHARGIPR